ncbi:hypothetical protein AVEN_117330-1 [Araneus ventricosus]|uniref:Uncharacterized protein n=1 Tax=Araneus ventricosus TaxID=182803 RepID=A0A4Y2JGU5_ARAVE|nr:hypothetical protein AVEN_117330-1 [Araneus ventricosus]
MQTRFSSLSYEVQNAPYCVNIHHVTVASSWHASHLQEFAVPLLYSPDKQTLQVYMHLRSERFASIWYADVDEVLFDVSDSGTVRDRHYTNIWQAMINGSRWVCSFPKFRGWFVLKRISSNGSRTVPAGKCKYALIRKIEPNVRYCIIVKRKS